VELSLEVDTLIERCYFTTDNGSNIKLRNPVSVATTTKLPSRDEHGLGPDQD